MKPHFLLALCLALSPFVAQAQDHAANIEKLKTYRYGGDDSALNALEGWVSATQSDAAKRGETARALAGVLASEASFDAKQFVCRQLTRIAGDEQIPALTGLLADENLAHYALMALARIPGAAVETALREALPKAKGRTQIGVIDLLGARRDKLAFVPLVELLAGDGAVSQAAALALGNIADPRCLPPLSTMYLASSGAKKMEVARALIVATDRMVQDGRGPVTPVYELLKNDTSPAIAAAALRGLVLSQGEKALPQLLEALGKDGTLQQKMATALARELKGARVTKSLGEKLPQLSPTGQLLLVTALGERADAAAAPAVAALLGSPDAAVREAAATAIGAIGDASTVPILLAAAPEQRAAARASLVRLRGAAVDEKLLAALVNATPATKVEIITALQGRRTVTATSKILPEARSANPEVRGVALEFLKELAGPDDLPKLLALLGGAAPDERAALLNTAAQIARRGGDEAQRTAPVLQLLAAAKSTTDKADLLGLLGRIGGAGALAELGKASRDAAPEIRLAALRALSAWPGDEPLDELLRVAKETTDERTRVMALRGALRMIGLSETRQPAATLALFRQAAALDKSIEGTKTLIAGLAKIKTPESLDYASGFLKDDAVRGEAELAVVEIARGTLGAWREKSRAALEPIARTSANENARKAAQEVLALAGKLGDFITAWEASPAYEKPGANSAQLFDVVFAPEEPGGKVAWRVVPLSAIPDQPWLADLLALHGGEQKVAYLRTSVWSETARELTLEAGSDDGLKVWWNGAVALSANVQRAAMPGQNKVKLTVKQGWNDLLLKVTQNNMGWGAVARLANPDGTAAAGLRCALPSSAR